MLEPSYEPRAEEALDKIEYDPDRLFLWNAIVLVINMICDHPDGAESRRSAVRVDGHTYWMVPVDCPIEDDNWVVMWYRNGEEAVISYVGPRPATR